MDFLMVVVLGIGLAMDAFAVSICKGLALRKTTFHDMLVAGLWFGIFQGLMPAIGYLFGSLFAQYIESVASWTGFILLTLIGGNMIRESLSKEEEEVDKSMQAGQMFLLAIATSIDALAVGITFSLLPVDMFAEMSQFVNTMIACLMICVETGIISMAGIKIGEVVGSRFKSKAEFAGGAILILIGLRIILTHFNVF